MPVGLWFDNSQLRWSSSLRWRWYVVFAKDICEVLRKPLFCIGTLYMRNSGCIPSPESVHLPKMVLLPNQFVIRLYCEELSMCKTLRKTQNYHDDLPFPQKSLPNKHVMKAQVGVSSCVLHIKLYRIICPTYTYPLNKYQPVGFIPPYKQKLAPLSIPHTVFSFYWSVVW